MTVAEAIKARDAAIRAVEAAQDDLTAARWALYEARMAERRESAQPHSHDEPAQAPEQSNG